MTTRTPRLMLFWTEYGIKRNRILYFVETLYSITILIADQVFSNGLDHKSIQYVALLGTYLASEIILELLLN